MSAAMRLWVVFGVLLASSLLMHTASHGEPIVPRHSFRELPYKLVNWRGQERPFTEQSVLAAGVSDYTNRIYFERGNEPIQLYIGYYESQKTGDTIHSPKNCLPGSGWEPIESGYMAIPITGRSNIIVNQYVVAKDQATQLVFYWYQGRGRVIASEYSSKFWMMIDAISRNRTDGALVRVITPMNDGETRAHARLLDFTQAIFSTIDALIPK